MSLVPISLEALEAQFRQRAASPGDLQTTRQVLDLASQFYLDTPIAGVDASEPEADMLLFQWGTYDCLDGHGQRFTLDVTRQFQIAGDEEFYQLSLSLYFPPEYDALGAGSCWSADYAELASWRRAVEQPALLPLWDEPAVQVEIRMSAT